MVPFLREHSSFVHFQGGMGGKLHPSCRKRIPFQGQYSPQPMPRLEAFLKGSDAERTSFKFPTKHLLTFTCFLPQKGFKWRFQNHLLRDVTSDSDESFTATLVFLTNLWWCKLSQLRFHKSHVASPKQHLELVSNIAGYSLANQISILDQNVHPRFMNAWLLSNCCSSISSRKSLISSSFFSHFCGRAKGTQIRRWVWKTGKTPKTYGIWWVFSVSPKKNPWEILPDLETRSLLPGWVFHGPAPPLECVPRARRGSFEIASNEKSPRISLETPAQVEWFDCRIDV